MTLIVIHYCIVKSFCELGPHLIKTTGNYLLSEVFSQDPLERYFLDNETEEEAMITPQLTSFRKMLQFFFKSNNFTGTTRMLILSPLNKIQQIEHVWNLLLNGLDMESDNI